MKPSTRSRLARLTAWALAAVLIFVHSAAQACPGCKQNLVPGANGSTPPLSGASIGFGLSIFFMIAMILGLLGFLGCLMYRSCQTLAARQRAFLEADDAEAAGGLPSRA